MCSRGNYKRAGKEGEPQAFCSSDIAVRHGRTGMSVLRERRLLEQAADEPFEEGDGEADAAEDESEADENAGPVVGVGDCDGGVLLLAVDLLLLDLLVEVAIARGLHVGGLLGDAAQSDR